MRSRTGLLLVLGVIAIAAGLALILLGEGLGGPSSPFGAGRGGEDEDILVGLDELGGVRLAPAPGAMTAEERDALRAPPPLEGPTFTKAEGVWGVVADARGAPIADAVVKLGVSKQGLRTWGIPDPPAIALASTGADGTFLVGPAPEEGILRLRAEAPGWAPSVKLVKRRGFRVDMVMYRGGALDVRVKSKEGEALPEAYVIHQAGQVVSDATTDAEGMARFPGLPTGQGTLVVAHADHASVRQEGVAVAPGRTEEHTVVLGEPIRIEGRVIDAVTERGVEGVSLTLRYPRMPWLEQEEGITSDPEGRFELPTVAPVGQSFEIDARAPGYTPSRSWFAVTDAGDGSMTLDVKLSQGSFAIEGEVRDHFGQAAKGVRVTYANQRAGQQGPETKTDGTGYFKLAAPAWASRPGASAQLVAVSTTLGLGGAFARFPKEGEQGKPVTIQLSGVGTIRGQVLDAGGNPLEGALVSLMVDWNSTMRSARQSGGGVPPWLLANLLQSSEFTRLDEVTDTEGRYVIDGVPAAAYLLSASFGLDSVTSGEPLTVASGATMEQNLTLGDGGTIEGWVQDAEGNPVEGAYVSGWPLQGRSRSASGVSGRSQEDGAFILHGASAEEYNIRAWAAGYESKGQQRVRSGETGVTLLVKSLGWVEGVVYYDGRPYEGTFTVQAQAVRSERSSQGMAQPWRGGGRSGTFSTDDGTFVLRNLRAGEYRISAQTGDGLIAVDPPNVKVGDGQGSNARITMVGGATVQGTVLGDESGGPIANATISVRPVQGEGAPTTSSRGRTDAKGRFSARGLAAGRYVVNVWPPSGITFHETIDLAEGQTQQVTLRERPPGQIRVIVRDSRGNPVEAATPRITGESGVQVWPNWAALRKEGYEFNRNSMRQLTTTDAAGTNVRQHIAPGRYGVSASKSGYGAAEVKWIEVRPRQTTDVQIVLPPGEGGAPPPGVPAAPVPFR